MSYNWKRNTTAFLVSQVISLFGSSLVQYAINWYITLEMKSGVYATLSIVCGFLPTFLLSPFAGVWADRYDRKKLIAIADGVIAFATLILAILLLNGFQSIWLLLSVMVVRALGSAVQQPCVSAMIPDMVPTEHLTRVNGIYGSISSCIFLVSPMISGVLMSFASLPAIFSIDVITAIAAISILLFWFRLPERASKAVQQSNNYFAEMKEGWRYIIGQPYLRNFFGFCTIIWMMVGPVSFLTPLQVVRNYGDEVFRLTAIEMGFSIGMLIGGLAISAWGGFKNRIHSLVAAGISMAIGTMALGFSMPFPVYVAIMGSIGLVMPLFNTPSTVLLQERVDPTVIGRVFGIMTMLSSSVMPLGMLLFGPLADIVPIEYLLVGTGMVMAVTCAVMFRNKPLLAAGIRASANEAAQ